jgi:predicted O-methyltransferase YrrM
MEFMGCHKKQVRVKNVISEELFCDHCSNQLDLSRDIYQDIVLGVDFELGMFQFSDQHQQALARILDMINDINDLKILEIGCWLGQSTNVIADFVKNKGRGSAIIHIIDTFEGSPQTDLVRRAKINNIERQFKTNMYLSGNKKLLRIHKAKSQEISHLFEENSLDFIFIDGDHRYDFIKQDIELYYPKLKNGGIICGHDYEGREYNEEFIHEDFVENRHNGVIKAVNEFFKDEVNQDFVFWWHKK